MVKASFGTGATDIAIAGGEGARQPGCVPDFLLAGTFSLIQPDFTVCGGFIGLCHIAPWLTLSKYPSCGVSSVPW